MRLKPMQIMVDDFLGLQNISHHWICSSHKVFSFMRSSCLYYPICYIISTPLVRKKKYQQTTLKTAYLVY